MKNDYFDKVKYFQFSNIITQNFDKYVKNENSDPNTAIFSQVTDRKFFKLFRFFKIFY